MEKNKISWARVSKNICYFLAPFFGLILIACITGLIIMIPDYFLIITSTLFIIIFISQYLQMGKLAK